MNMNNWTTWWSRAQRGVGLLTKNNPSNIKLTVNKIPKCKSMRFTFGACYDCQPVTIKDVFCCNDTTKVAVTFKGQSYYQIEPGEMIVCDAIDMQAFDDKITLTYEIVTKQDYYCVSGFGVESYDKVSTEQSIVYLLRNIEVLGSSLKGCICAFGDSITEQGNWTTPLTTMLEEQGYALLQLGISGNRLLRELETVTIRKDYYEDMNLEHKVYTQIPLAKQCFGKAGVKRFMEDVLTCHNCKGLLLALGVNDLYQPGTFCASMQEFPTVENMIQGYDYIQSMFDKEKILVIGITSFLGSEASSIGKEEVRQQINQWLESQFDNYVSFDQWLLNEYGQMKKEYHNGDYLHPNAQAGLLMAKDIMEKWRCK